MVHKSTIPLHLFLSGAGTGKSRHAVELHHTALICFNDVFPFIDNELAHDLHDPLVFHISYEDGSGIQIEDISPW